MNSNNINSNHVKTSEPFTISRRFKAPRELIWKAWIDPQYLKQWFGPAGFTMPYCKMDFRPGGIFHYSQKTPDGSVIWGKWKFIEIEVPTKIKLIQSFSDEHESVTRHPFSPDWPLQIMSTTTFDENNGETIVRIEWVAYEATEIEHATFTAGHESMQGGWTGVLDRLETYLPSLT